ncbi:acetylornithine/succinylornithine family transaminase [Sedimentibacter sp. zth1]|uniref:aspartate aminotransferase family protein n=1 Tax=Sedimentibacter sp. zth1 TaxID=2816908 RepID=UPI001A90EBAC|nr:acetylornithine/succinylornithine family transaminase [Sedimentibacter sp. zth1]QSX05126.1 acetylornithine/succinylornithine family transaminase [Sedimentibacter sp. zth1]
MTDFIELKNNDKKYISNTYDRMNLYVKYSEGSFLIDNNNNKYLDMFSGIGVNNFGGKNSVIKNAIQFQVNNYLHLSNYFYSETAIDLAKTLVQNSFAKKVFFTNSGTESNEAAIKLCLKYGHNISENKNIILSAFNSFHGRTMGSLSLTGQKKYQNNFEPLLPNVKHFEFNNVNLFKEIVNENICAIFIELIQGEGGIVEITSEFLQCIVEYQKKYNYLIIIDEIQTGLGRTGKLFAYENYDIVPDAVTIAKSLGAGLPIGALLIGEKCENILKVGEHGSTFAPNPVSATCGNNVLSMLLKDGFIDNINYKSKYIINKLNNLKSKYSYIIKSISGKGLMIGINVGEYANVIKEDAFRNQLLLNVTSKNIIRLLPPLNITIEEIELFLEKFEKSLINCKTQ